MATARMTQNSLILNNLMSFYNTDGNLEKIPKPGWCMSQEEMKHGVQG